MNDLTRTTGLGEPEKVGKKVLFQPIQPKALPKPKKPIPKPGPQKIRTSLILTREALTIIENMRQEYRMRTGKSLRMWQAICQTIEYYGKREQTSLGQENPHGITVGDKPGASHTQS